jgi:hypothetical protein
MTATIILRDNPTSGSVPIASALHQAELVLNTADGRLFTKNSSGDVILLNARPTVNGVDYQYITNIPVGLVSSSTQALLWTVASASLANSIDFVNIFGKPTLVSSSAQIDYTSLRNIPIGVVSSSVQATTWTVATASYVDYVNVDNKPTGLVSSSGQIDYPGVSNIPSGIVSSSTQAALWTVATASLANAVEYSNVTGKPIGLVSASAQVDYTAIQNKPSTIATASYVDFADVVSKPTGLVSSSTQVDYTGLSNTPVGIVSSSIQVSYTGLSNTPVGIVSSSVQVDYTGLSNTPTGLVSSSAQVSYTGLSNTPVGIVSSSVQLTSASISANTLIDPLIQNYSEIVSYPAISANALTLDLSLANVFDVVIDANITTFTLANPPSSSLAESFTFIARYDGSRSITWPVDVKWAGGIAPTISTTSGSTDIFTFVTNNSGGKYYGVFIGKGY